MRPIIWRSIAAVNALLALTAAARLEAARRPRYGGELRVEMRATLMTLDPADSPEDPAALAAQRLWLPTVFETLVKLDDYGEPQPWLATSWTHDPVRKVWVFAARKDVKFHDGTPWSPPGGSIVVPDDRPIERILREMAGARSAISMRAADGTLLGTGPFKIGRWDAGKSVSLAANDEYWGGRPYLDSISIQMGRSLAEQANDFQLGRTDVTEIPVRDLRAPRARGMVASDPSPMETLALQFDVNRVQQPVREALALTIDRPAIHNVLLQMQGEISGALLPQWLSGYSFLFPAERSLVKARQLSPAARTLTFGYDRDDAVVRPIAERIAVNAGEAGITLRQSQGAADLRLVRLPITAGDPWLALQDLAALLKAPQPGIATSPYEAEKALLEESGLVPLFHLPRVWVVQQNVRNWPRLEDAWLDPRTIP
jgi:peptide/nickel transport system substrate-binding protein